MTVFYTFFKTQHTQVIEQYSIIDCINAHVQVPTGFHRSRHSFLNQNIQSGQVIRIKSNYTVCTDVTISISHRLIVIDALWQE